MNSSRITVSHDEVSIQPLEDLEGHDTEILIETIQDDFMLTLATAAPGEPPPGEMLGVRFDEACLDAMIESLNHLKQNRSFAGTAK